MRYNKLVRDNVPDILEKKGKRVLFSRANSSEYKLKLKEKLKEETQEYIIDGAPEDLVDVLEVVYALAEQSGLSKQKLEKLRKAKAEFKGTFDKRTILKEVKD